MKKRQKIPQKHGMNPAGNRRRFALRGWGMAALAVGAVLLVSAGWFWWPQRGGMTGGGAPGGWKSGPEDGSKLFAKYAGSQSCRPCHLFEYDLWAASNHGLAERELRPGLDRAAFDPARSFRHGSQTTQTRLQAGASEIVTLGFGSNVAPYRVERVIGNNPLRQFLTASKDGRWQVLEASYDPKSNEWFNVYGNEDRQPGEWGHWTGRGMNWNSRCAECHNTRLRKNYDEATDAYHTTMAEMTVGCEACHGPLKAHVVWRRAHPNAKLADPSIPAMQSVAHLPPGDAARAQSWRILGVCGSCHARRDDLTGDFQPGESFFDHFSLDILDEGDRWYADGQVREEDYEFTSFVSSQMHQSGVSCLDCHNPHSGKTLLPGNALCMRCHQAATGAFTNAPVINLAEHVHHQPDGKGAECVGCHMPLTVYMQRHPRHDHGFTIPDPLLTKESKIPNACNRCHADKSADWALDYTQKWYGTNMVRHTRERAQWIASAQRGEDGAKTRLLGLLADSKESSYWRAVAAGLLRDWVGEGAPGFADAAQHLPSTEGARAANIKEVQTALLAALKDVDPLVRERAARSLEPLAASGQADRAVAEALKPLLDDPARSVRVAAEWDLRTTVLPSRAVAELQLVMAQDADQPTGQFRKAQLLLDRQQPAEALAHLLKAIDRDPLSPPLRYQAAIALSQLNRPAEAVEQLQVACRLEPQSAEARFQLGLGWAEAGSLDKAAQALEEAVRLDPRQARAWYNLGLARDKLGNAPDALDALARAETLALSDPQIPYARATILARDGRFAEARAALNRALEIQPGFQPARALLSELPAGGR
jgi:predicted CXXCH cytochrome family protein